MIYRYWTDLPGTGDYVEEDLDESSTDMDAWYMFNEDRSEGWDESDEC